MINTDTIHGVHQALKKKEVSARELVASIYERIERLEGDIGAYITLTPDMAFAQADAADRAISSGDIGPLTGIPIAIKDNICTRGVRTTCASHILSDFLPPYDATVVSLLTQAGAICIGKTNMDEFAMGSSTENSSYKITRNPVNTAYVPGGSSGGSAASVSAGMAVAALGSDTGGSIRQPASYCGIVGLKPTYGRVSRYGLVAFASSLDQIGPLCKNVTDTATMMDIISGHDTRDATCAKRPPESYTSGLGASINGVRVGIPKEYFIEGIEGEVSAAVNGAIQDIKKTGCVVKEVSLPHTPYTISTYYVLATAEASSNLARYDGVRYGYRVPLANSLLEMYTKSRMIGFGPEVKRRIMLGTYVLSSGYYDAYYKKAQQMRTLITQDFMDVFKQVDVVLTPTAPTTAFKIGEKSDNPLQMYLSDIFTISVNLAGLPAISIPCGMSKEGLPIGFQLIGRPFDETHLLNIAYQYEKKTTVCSPTIKN